MEGIILVEFTHRTFSTLTGLLILLNAYWQWKTHPNDRLIRILSVLSVVLLGSVAVMGGINVLHKLPSGLTAIDMALATLLAAELVILMVRVNGQTETGAAILKERQEQSMQAYKRVMKPAAAVVTAVYSEILLGGFFKHSSASYTYVHPATPLKNELVTRFATAELVMYLHMFTGFFVVLSLFWLFVHAKKQNLFVKHSVLLLILAGVQMFLGFFSIATKLELLTTVAHMAVATLMLMIGAYVVTVAQQVLAGADRVQRPATTISSGHTAISNG